MEGVKGSEGGWRDVQEDRYKQGAGGGLRWNKQTESQRDKIGKEHKENEFTAEYWNAEP